VLAGRRCEDGAQSHMDHTPRLLSAGVSRFVILACGVNGRPPLLGITLLLERGRCRDLISGLFCPRFEAIGCTFVAGHVIGWGSRSHDSSMTLTSLVV
jgi:hypothetical protein